MRDVSKRDASQNTQQWELWLDGPNDLVAAWNAPASRIGQSQRDVQRRALPARSQFFGVADESEARAILLGNGWKEGAELVARISNDVKEQLPPPKSRRRQRHWDDSGDAYSWERAQAGFEPWESSKRNLRSALGLIEVVQEWGDGCGAGLAELRYAGAAALALTDLLENADYAVELALCAAMQGFDSQGNFASPMLIRVDLKQMGEPLDIEKLAAVAVHPAIWRTYGLASFQLGPWCEGTNYNSHNHVPAMPSMGVIAGKLLQTYGGIKSSMWGYRPNVMTLPLSGGISTHSEAVLRVKQAIELLDSLVNPKQEWEQ